MSGATGVVVVVTTAQNPHQQVVTLVRGLLERGDEVHVLTTAAGFWQGIGEPAPRVRAAERREGDHPVTWTERLLVQRIPKTIARVGDRLAKARPKGWTGRLGAAAAKAQRRVSGAVHERLFMPGYREFRPLIMTWVFRSQLRTLDLDRIDRIVAADLNAVPSALRLARRYPSAHATNSLRLDAR